VLSVRQLLAARVGRRGQPGGFVAASLDLLQGCDWKEKMSITKPGCHRRFCRACRSHSRTRDAKAHVLQEQGTSDEGGRQEGVGEVRRARESKGESKDEGESEAESESEGEGEGEERVSQSCDRSSLAQAPRSSSASKGTYSDFSAKRPYT